MIIKEIDKELDLDELWRWYRGQGWDSKRDDDIFPEIGYMVKDHAAVWVYIDSECKFAWVAFQVINPRKNMAMAMKALHLLYEKVEASCKGAGIKYLQQTVSHSSLKKLALQHNYAEGEGGLSSYWKVL